MWETFDQQWHHALICVTEHKMLKHHIHHKKNLFVLILSTFLFLWHRFCNNQLSKKDLFQVWVPLTWTNSYTKLHLIKLLSHLEFIGWNFSVLTCLLCVSLSGHPRGSRKVDDRLHQRDHSALSFPCWDQVFLHAALWRWQTPHWVGTNVRAHTWI